MQSRRIVLSALLLAWLASPSHGRTEAGTKQPTDCITDAAKHHGVNESILRAIIWGESKMKANAHNVNDNGSVDVGAAQTNSIHFRDLSRYGIKPADLYDGCVSVYVGAWMYSKHVAALGNTWEAVGAYHSRTPFFQQAYANGVATTMSRWGLLQQGWLPFPSAPRSTAEAIRIRKGMNGMANGQQQKPTSRTGSAIVAIAD